MKPAKTILTVHDLSSVGRCALTVAIPALAAAGCQPIPLPTAVLSTHTGGFRGMARRDLTDFMKESIDHWRRLGLRFDAIYTGYLAEPAQGELLLELIESARGSGDVFVLVDPAMGDDGALYHSIDPAMPGVMRELCRRADLITPNITEAFLLCGEEPRTELDTEEEARALFEGIGAKECVITGAKVAGEHVNLLKDGAVPYRMGQGEYPGTGDLFSSVLLGRLMRGEDLRGAVEFASDFVSRAVFDTREMGCEARLGLQFEMRLRELADPAPGRKD